MIAIDTSSMIAYLEGSQDPNVEMIEQVFSDQIGVFPSVVLTELLSYPAINTKTKNIFWKFQS